MQQTVPIQTQTLPIHAHAGTPFDAKETSHDTVNSVMAHNTRATKKQPALSTASAEELSVGKEIAQDTPTTAPLAPLDRLSSGLYPGHLPQDTAIILRWAVTRLQGYKVCVHVCVCVHE